MLELDMKDSLSSLKFLLDIQSLTVQKCDATSTDFTTMYQQKQGHIRLKWFKAGMYRSYQICL